MSQLRRIMISLPDDLLDQVDSIVAKEKTNRTEFVREAMSLYIREKKKIGMKDRMKKGYIQMGRINLNLAEDCFGADNCAEQEYEKHLRELGK